MLENTLNTLADALRVHAAAMAELASALRSQSANEPIFMKPLAKGEDPMDPPFEYRPDLVESVPADKAMEGIPLPSEEKKPEPETEPEQEPIPEQPKPEATFPVARAYASRIFKWHSKNNAGNANPLDEMFASIGAEKVSTMTPEQLAKFCEQAEAFCQKVEA